MKTMLPPLGAALLAVTPAFAQPPPCRVLCAPEFKVEPTVTFGAEPPRIEHDGGTVSQESPSAEFEAILSLGIPSRLSWLELTVEAIFLPFERDSTPELEFETNLIWLASERTGGWVISHFDIVDKFSPAERETDRRAYTHKLNFELDTSLSIFNWLPEGRWLRGVELEGSLDYVASGLPKAGDPAPGGRYLDDTSPWSFSVVLMLPVAPL